MPMTAVEIAARVYAPRETWTMREELRKEFGLRPGGGYLYAIVADEVKRVKIGCGDPVERLLNFQCGSPCELEIHSAIWVGENQARSAEKEAHNLLAPARVDHLGGREWFDMRDWRVDRWLGDREMKLAHNS